MSVSRSGHVDIITSTALVVTILVIDDVEVREEAGEVIVTIRKVGGAGYVVEFDVETRAFTGSGAGATGQLRNIHDYAWHRVPVVQKRYGQFVDTA